LTDEARAVLAACLHRVAAGDRTALAELYRLTSGKLFAVCLRILVQRAEAEDVLQDVYLTVWKKAGLFDPARGVSPITWLAAVARNRALDRLRAKGRRFAGMDEAAEIPDFLPLADEVMETGEMERRLTDCLAALDERAAGAIRAAFFGGQTYESLAKGAEMPLGSMKSLIRRGFMRLKAWLES